MTIEALELEQLLSQLGDEKHSIAFSRLYALSDLAGARLGQFRAAWAGYSQDARRLLLHRLVELAEANFEVNYDAIYRFCLDDEDEEIRSMAIDGLWENESPSLVGPFLSRLCADPSSRVRASAASGLGRFVLAGELEELDAAVEERIVSELLTVLQTASESVDVRRRALESVAYACRPEILDALELAYYGEEAAMRISAVVGMGRSCDKRWQPMLLEELNSPSPDMRYEACLACGELALRSAVPALAGLTRDPDRQVSYAAIWALGQVGGEPAKQALLTAYEDADEDTEAALDEALAEHALADGDLDFLIYQQDEEADDLDTEPVEDEAGDTWASAEEEQDDLADDDLWTGELGDVDEGAESEDVDEDDWDEDEP